MVCLSREQNTADMDIEMSVLSFGGIIWSVFSARPHLADYSWVEKSIIESQWYVCAGSKILLMWTVKCLYYHLEVTQYLVRF